MEIFIHGIPLSVTRYDLTRTLEPILHGVEFWGYYDGGAPFNFIAHIFHDKYRKKRTRCGKIVVPKREIGLLLLEITRMKPITFHGRAITLQESRNAAKEDELALLKEPYQDPEILEHQQRRRERLEGGVHIRSVSFGWPCVDDKVSIEWESDPERSWKLIVEDDKHQIVVQSNEQLRITINLRSIQNAAADSSQCVFWIEYPPTFDTDPTPLPLHSDDLFANLFREMVLYERPRIRLSALPDDTYAIIPFLRVLRLEFEDRYARMEYQKKATELGLSLDVPTHTYVRRGLFRSEVREAFRGWLKDLPFVIAFQLEGIMSRRRFNPRELLKMKEWLEYSIKAFGEAPTCRVIRNMESERDGNPNKPAFEILVSGIQQLRNSRAVKESINTGSIFQCHRVVITPTSTILSGPIREETNRVLRKYITYQSNFIRVEIREEDGLKLRSERELDTSRFLDKHIAKILKEGILVAGRKYEFLGYSTSALRQHSMWFVSPFLLADGTPVNGNSIRRELGDFTSIIDCPARLGARIGQAFSTTEPGVTVRPGEKEEILDKKSDSGFDFTDGIGTASPEIMEEIWDNYLATRSIHARRRPQIPSAFQIRFGGAKGMLCVDSRLEGRKVCIRPSMDKFRSPESVIEVCEAFDRPMTLCLNRPLIMLLETLGVPLEPFMELQQAAVRETELANESLDTAAHLLDQYGLGTAYLMTSILLQLHKLKVKLKTPDREEGFVSFLRRSIRFGVNDVLRDMKHKSRIPLPGAWMLVGVADEYDFLKEGEIYAHICTMDGRNEHIEGPVLITRNPVSHPGDLRIVRAIGQLPDHAPKGLKALVNCIVFNCKGQRPLTSMLAGGDLDGDTYCLILDKRLHPLRIHDPADYKPAQLQRLGRPAEGEDIAQFVVDYIKNDLLGVIATRLLLTADLKEECMLHPDCLQLANLHSIAVDFPKTGKPVDSSQLPAHPGRLKPDWYATETSYRKTEFYKSKRIIGQLFREIDLPAIPEAKRMAKRQHSLVAQETDDDFPPEAVYQALRQDNVIISKLLRPQISRHISSDRLRQVEERKLVGEMLDIYAWYSAQLIYICKTYSLSLWTPISEEEVVAGTIVAKCAQPRMRSDLMSAMRRESTKLCADVKGEIKGGDSGELGPEEQCIRAWYAWKTAEAFEDAYGAKSLGILALDVLFNAFATLDQKARDKLLSTGRQS